jgi:RNA polymerase primary sigma factor
MLFVNKKEYYLCYYLFCPMKKPTTKTTAKTATKTVTAKKKVTTKKATAKKETAKRETAKKTEIIQSSKQDKRNKLELAFAEKKLSRDDYEMWRDIYSKEKNFNEAEENEHLRPRKKRRRAY